MEIRIGNHVFRRADYDSDGDVLYLGRSEAGPASVASLTPEGHGVRFDADGDVIGLTIIDARRLLERDGHLTITLPQALRVEGDELATALTV